MKRMDAPYKSRVASSLKTSLVLALTMAGGLAAAKSLIEAAEEEPSLAEPSEPTGEEATAESAGSSLDPQNPLDPTDPRTPGYTCLSLYASCTDHCLPLPPIEDVLDYGYYSVDNGPGTASTLSLEPGLYVVEEGVGSAGYAAPGTCCWDNQPSSCGEHEGLFIYADSDDDGLRDNQDNCVYTPNADQADDDGDTWGNACDLCSQHYSLSNQDDFDGDGIGDACDDDLDGDGIDNLTDLCPDDNDPLELDTDGDNVPDTCDDDDDNDCILDTGSFNYGGDGWPLECQDNDGDGWSEVEGDCDDTKSQIYPGNDCSHPDCTWQGPVTDTGYPADNCWLDYNPDQQDTDGDAQGDACDPCPDTSGPCAPTDDTFCDLANIEASTPQCSTSGFAVVENCYDLDLPPAPTIRRAFVPSDPYARSEVRTAGHGRRLPELWNNQYHSQVQGESKIVDLPRHRATPDGRLSTGKDGYGHPTISAYFPENLNQGSESHHERRVYSDGIRVPVPARYFPPVSVNLIDQPHRTPRMTLQDYAEDEALEMVDGQGLRGVWSDLDDPTEWPAGVPTSLNWDLCDGDHPEAFACTASNNGNNYSGQCYLDTLLVTNQFMHGTNSDIPQWELRSIDTVVFAGSTSGAPLHLPNANPNLWQPNTILVFPRTAFEEVAIAPVPLGTSVNLGAYDVWDIEDYYPSWPGKVAWLTDHPKIDYVNHENFLLMVEDACLDDGGAPPERWCEWADEQEVRRAFTMRDTASTSTVWDGETTTAKNLQLLEPATTEDGRLLAMHIAGSIRYSYNAGDSCAAREFNSFYPLSHAHHDDQLFHSGTAPIDPKYGFAAEKLRFPSGPGNDILERTPTAECIQDWDPVPGSYPWISAKGEVLVWPMANMQFGWKPEWVYSGNQAYSDTCETQRDEVQNEDLHVNTVGAVVAGSWTRGKIVLMDNMINYSNFQGAEDHAAEIFRMPLYADTDVFVRARGISLLNSIENTMNHVEAVSPLSPFDVVWLMSSNGHQTGELVFDDYLHPRAYVVGHMNETLRNFNPYAVKAADGFTRVGDDGATAVDDTWRFTGSPSLQNASTVLAAPAMRLLGGAFVPPVAEGGVQGKGVFLDGINDHIEVAGLSPLAEDDFLVSVWLESHAADPTEERVLLSFADTSYVTVKDGQVRLKQGTSTVTWTPPTPFPSATRHQYYTHYALTFYDLGSGPMVRLYVDGNDQGAHTAPVIAGLPRLGRGAVDALQVGKTGAYPNPLEPPVRGWVDELRVYGLNDNTALAMHEVEESFFAEWLCNRALGSLTGTLAPVCEQLDFRHADPNVAPDGWQYAGPETLPVGDGQDYVIQAYNDETTCANQAHRSPDPILDCVRADVLGLPDLVLGQPREDATTQAFCLSCHKNNHPTDGLWVTAAPLQSFGPLEYDVGTNVEDDPRRQPLMWPSHASGYLPHVGNMSWGQVGTPTAFTIGQSLDQYVLPSLPNVGATKLEPRP